MLFSVKRITTAEKIIITAKFKRFCMRLAHGNGFVGKFELANMGVCVLCPATSLMVVADSMASVAGGVEGKGVIGSPNS